MPGAANVLCSIHANQAVAVATSSHIGNIE
jgi:hypothetical protein